VILKLGMRVRIVALGCMWCLGALGLVEGGAVAARAQEAGQRQDEQAQTKAESRIDDKAKPESNSASSDEGTGSTHGHDL